MDSISISESVLAKDEIVAKLFLCPDRAPEFIKAIEGPVKDWVNRNNKQHWEVVRLVCEEEGWLGKRTKKGEVKLGRKDFAQVLYTFCNEALVEGETEERLLSSMEKYNKMGKEIKEDVSAVRELFAQNPPSVQEVASSPTLEDIVAQYLRTDVGRLPDGYPKWVVRERPVYEGCRPGVSVERYLSEILYTENRPTSIDAYEFVKGKLKLSKLYELIGQYGDYQNMKLFVVSTEGLSAEVRSTALNKNVGYVRLNPNIPMKSNSYELPRRVECLHSQRLLYEKLMSHKMDIPLLVKDGPRLCTSFSALWEENSLVPKKRQNQNVPFLSKEAIEDCSAALTRFLVAEKIRQYENSKADMSIDPFAIAAEQGLTCEIRPLEDTLLLGRIDVARGHVTLNERGKALQERFRFTMAHELGHFLLHAQGFTSPILLEDTEETISDVAEFTRDEALRIESQANSFAAHLLMPRELVAVLYTYYYKMHITRLTGHRPQPLYYSPTQPETYAYYNYLISNISRRLKVSHEAVKYRLLNLNLLKIG